jgi:hypothetical protein
VYQLLHDTEPHASMQLRAYNLVTPIEQSGEPVTKSPDAAVAPR